MAIKADKESNYLTSYNDAKSRKIVIKDMLNEGKIYTFNSLLKSVAFIKEASGSVDRSTMRKYIGTAKLYKKRWLIE